MAFHPDAAALGNFFGATAEDFLVDDPRSAFMGVAQGFGTTPRRRRFVRDFFPTFQDIFRGERARSLEAGILPTETVTQRATRFPFLERFLARSPRARGDNPTRFAPRTRFNFLR